MPFLRNPYGLALASAVLFGLSTPLAKILLEDVSPLALAGYLYLGAFLGLSLVDLVGRIGRRPSARAVPLTRRDIPWLAGAVIAGGIVGPICLLYGLARVQGFTASLLLNLEGAATAIIAVAFFSEHAGRRLWLALAAMSAAGVFLSWNTASSSFAWTGVLLILAAMIAWGLDNNLTRAISGTNPVRVAQVKGFVAGAFSLGLAVALRQRVPLGPNLAFGLAVGALGYGLSLVLYIRALAGLGAFRAGAFFSAAPFVGALASLVILKERPAWPMAAGAGLMLFGALAILGERHEHSHRHSRLVHVHNHRHGDGHHAHGHAVPSGEPHSHEHVHEEVEHTHGHWPDLHHRHGH